MLEKITSFLKTVKDYAVLIIVAVLAYFGYEYIVNDAERAEGALKNEEGKVNRVVKELEKERETIEKEKESLEKEISIIDKQREEEKKRLGDIKDENKDYTTLDDVDFGFSKHGL